MTLNCELLGRAQCDTMKIIIILLYGLKNYFHLKIQVFNLIGVLMFHVRVEWGDLIPYIWFSINLSS